MPRELAFVLHRSQPLDQRLGRDKRSTAGHERPERSAEAALGGPADVVRLEPEPADPFRDPVDRLELVRRPADLELDVDTGTSELLARLLAIAAVGDEQRVARRHEQHPGRSGEPREIADVHERGYE